VKLVLFRHGIAVDREDPDCPADPDRTLTDRGIRRTLAAARGLKALGVSPDTIRTSPYRRAVQTAGIAAEVLGVSPDRVEITDLLLPGASPREAADLARDLGVETVLFAGHAPGLDLILSSLLDLSRTTLPLKKAGAACVELNEDARLCWFLEPRALRLLGG